MSIKEVLLEKFNSGEAENLGIKRICELFEAKSQFEKQIVRDAIESLLGDGKIVYQNGRFVLFENSGLLKGKLRGNQRGFAFLITENGDFFIPARSLHGALDGDTVVAKKVKGLRGSDDEAEVLSIIERGRNRLVGTFQGENGFGFVIADDKEFSVDVYVPIKKTKGAKTGDKVLVQIVNYPENRKNPEGVVLQIIGKKFDSKAEELSIILNANLPLEFPKQVLDEVEKIPSEVLPSELKCRKDYRNQTVITIDGDDSRDFDDAISVQKNDNETYTLFVHIADVSHYVKRNSRTDKEALNRSTSVYFPERVIPMLPKKLSNGICSLNEGVDRLTLSVEMVIDKQGNVIENSIYEGVIRSKHRMTYKNVQKMLDGDSETIKSYKDVYSLITFANELKNVLSNKRRTRGNIDLKVDESHIYVDEKGKVQVEKRQYLDAYKMIEEFMIVANETVAEYIFYMDLPFIYRVHEKPSEEKLLGFITFLNALGITFKWNEESCHSKDFQTILENNKDKPYFDVLNKVMLRSMQKAKYSPNNVGHFGLSSKCYCHFTSPIRRYPDLVVHNILKGVLNGKDVESAYSEFVGTASLISSENERKADEVEREMDDYYKCRYMRSYIGCEFAGIVSGVSNQGVYVELENTVEGFVRSELLRGRNYELDATKFTLTNGINSYTLGDKVEVLVLGVDFSAKRVDFKLLNS